MATVLKVRNENGSFVDIPCLVGPQGDRGPQGPQGKQGNPGPAVPVIDNLSSTLTTSALSANQGRILSTHSVKSGGTAGQVLKKKSNNSYDLEWGDAADPNAIVGDGSIKKIIQISYTDYRALEAAKKVDPNTEYHILEGEQTPNDYVAALKQTVIDSIYPTGAVYISTSETNPHYYLGGTWEAISQGRCLLGVGTSKANNSTYFGEDSGGISYYSQEQGGQARHTLTAEEAPKHFHDMRWGNKDGTGVTISSSGTGSNALNVTAFQWTHNTDNGVGSGANVFTSERGGSQAHNNMPPYFAVYIWKRIG